MNEEQIVLAAEISVESPDFGHLEPIVDATVCALERAGVAEKPKVAVADAGYRHHEQMDSLAAGGIQVLIPPDAGKRKGARPGLAGRPLRVECAGCSRPSPASADTENAHRRSSRCSVTPSTTAA